MDQKLIGAWAGMTPEGAAVRFEFRADGSVLWRVDAAESPGDLLAKYAAEGSKEPCEIDIFEFAMPELQGFRFLGIYRHEGERLLRFYGEPRAAGNLQPRPVGFSEQAIVLRREGTGGGG